MCSYHDFLNKMIWILQLECFLPQLVNYSCALNAETASSVDVLS